MTTAIQQAAPGSLATLDADVMQNLIAGGDCSRLNPQQKVAYYQARCDAAGLDPRAQPFAFMRLNGKEVLYALKAASDQLAAKHGVKMTIVSQATEEGIRVVTVRAEAKDGRVTEEIGALPVKGLQGDALANALMKAVTKAKRRAVLSLCGLGMLDETELETIPSASQDFDRRAANTVAVAEMAQTAKESGKPALPPPYVADLWARVKKEYGEEAREQFAAAAKRTLGDDPPPSQAWTQEQAAMVEKALFDISY